MRIKRKKLPDTHLAVLVPASIASDTTLSLSAKGMLLVLLTMPAECEFSDILNLLPNSIQARAALRTLAERGYVSLDEEAKQDRSVKTGSSSTGRKKSFNAQEYPVTTLQSIPSLGTAGQKPTPHQEMFGAICEVMGVDYAVATQDTRGSINRDSKILLEAGYTSEDVRRWYTDVWQNGWQYQKSKQRPTQKQIRSGIGQIKPKKKEEQTLPYYREPGTAFADIAACLDLDMPIPNRHSIDVVRKVVEDYSRDAGSTITWTYEKGEK